MEYRNIILLNFFIENKSAHENIIIPDFGIRS